VLGDPQSGEAIPGLPAGALEGGLTSWWTQKTGVGADEALAWPSQHSQKAPEPPTILTIYRPRSHNAAMIHRSDPPVQQPPTTPATSGVGGARLLSLRRPVLAAPRAGLAVPVQAQLRFSRLVNAERTRWLGDQPVF